MEKYNYNLGKLGEKIAEKYLIKNKYTIIEKNFYSKQGEIDIIAEEKDTREIVFIEVRTKDAVTINKRKHMYKTARYYLYKNKNNNQFIRFDVIEIIIKGKKDWLNHIKNIEVVEV